VEHGPGAGVEDYCQRTNCDQAACSYYYYNNIDSIREGDMVDKKEAAINIDTEEFVERITTAVESYINKEMSKARKRVFFAGFAFGVLTMVFMLVADTLLEVEYKNWMTVINFAILFVSAYVTFYLYERVILKWWNKDDTDA